MERDISEGGGEGEGGQPFINFYGFGARSGEYSTTRLSLPTSRVRYTGRYRALYLPTARVRYTGRYTVELSLSTIGIDIEVDIIELSISTSRDIYMGRLKALYTIR